MNIVYIGVNVLMIEQVIGVTSGIALRKENCTRKKPTNEAANIFGKSFGATFSRGKHNDNIQKRIPAPKALRQNNARGESKWLFDKSLHVTMLMPKIV